jgi:hypothetical protein
MPTLILRFLSTKTIAALAFSALAFSALTCFTLTLAMVPLSSIAQTAKAPQVSMKTSMGEIIIELYPDKATGKTATTLARYFIASLTTL